MIKLVQVKTDTEIHAVAGLAEVIWNEYFPAIIGQAQVDYMVHKFQSREAIAAQLNTGFLYYLINNGQDDVGYLGLVSQDSQESLQLSKLYILKDWRQQGIAREVLKEIMSDSREKGYTRLFLTVNKYNRTAIAAYEKLGFGHIGEMITDIGQGFTMDDYVMEITIAG
ncbi:MAG: GNAT family N-acetyltransferase [Balneolales bacterium]